MTNWLPDLTSGNGPLYQRLADRIEADIDAGILTQGTRLPPQRDLAFDIKTTVGTIGRAYSLLRRRGLVSGEVGRGTYVTTKNGMAGISSADPERNSLRSLPARPMEHDVAAAGLDRLGTRASDVSADAIRLDSTSAINVGQSRIIADALSAAALQSSDVLTGYVRTYPQHWRDAGSQWLARNGFRPDPTSILPTFGTHTGAMAAVAALTSPGDYVASDHLTYAPVARAASLAGRRITLVDFDEHGMTAESLDRVCAQKHPTLAFLMPTRHNPTLATMPASRRRDIAEVARKHNVMLVEDDLYGNLSSDPTPLLAEYAPERTIVVSGLSKAVAAGLRGGWLSAPLAYVNRIRVAHRLQAGALPYIIPEASAQLVLSGEAGEIRTSSLNEIGARIELARQILAGYDFNADPTIPFVWLALPGAWNSRAFKDAAQRQSVLVDDEDEYKVGRSDRVFHRARFTVSAPPDRETLARGLTILRRLLDEGPVDREWID